MLAQIQSFSLLGLDALPVEVEVDIASSGLPKTVIVGLPESVVRESTHRVERALDNSGFQVNQQRVVINLAPAELPKNEGTFDLPIALGTLIADGQVTLDRLDEYAVVGELALDGTTRSARGVLSIAMAAAQQSNLRGVLVPAENAQEAAVVEDIDVIPISSLTQAIAFLSDEIEIDPVPSRIEEIFAALGQYDIDFADVRGQEAAKRALTVAAAGGHNVMMVGPPGSGKSMLAKRLATVLPDLTPGESIETTRIYSIVGQLESGRPLLATRPFRAPHHTVSHVGLVGGGSPPAPGEISMAHNGVLFLDELPEFNRKTLEVLRQPLEDSKVTITRAMCSSTYPANFMLVAAMNPCPCGYRNDPRRDCHCSLPQIERYMNRISGPLVDRIDIQIEVPAVAFKELSSERPGTSSTQIREQVTIARHAQQQRFQGSSSRHNADMSSRELRTVCRLEPSSMQMLRTAMNEFGLSARAHDKVLRVARTIADLDSSQDILSHHLAEAINYRMLDRDLWT